MFPRLDLSRGGVLGRTRIIIEWDSNGEYFASDRTSVMVLRPFVRSFVRPFAWANESSPLAREFPLASATSVDQKVGVLLLHRPESVLMYTARITLYTASGKTYRGSSLALTALLLDIIELPLSGIPG